MNHCVKGAIGILALLVTPLVQAAADGRGPFEAVAASETAVWVIDTRTGQVRKCTQEFADQTPKCTAMSE